MKKNVIGPQVQKIRNEQGLTQDQLIARCEINGFNLPRASLAKIETQDRIVTDLELMLLAKVLSVSVYDLAPKKLPKWQSRRQG